MGKAAPNISKNSSSFFPQEEKATARKKKKRLPDWRSGSSENLLRK